MNYAIYPFKNMRITQRHDQGNHIAHWKNSKNYSDKPIDEACLDGGQSCFEPQNDFKVINVIGLDSSSTRAYTNTVVLKSVDKLAMPCGRTDYLYITLTHTNESDLKHILVGTIIKAGTKNIYLREGTDGLSTGNHFHCTFNVGKYYGCLKNSNGKWCYTYEKSLLPNEAFYVNDKVNIINANGYTFQKEPQHIYKYVSATAGLVLRSGVGTSATKILTIPYNSKVEVLNNNAIAKNGYNWVQVKYNDKIGYVANKFLK